MNDRQHIFDKPRNVQRVLYGLYASCIILFCLDFLIHRHSVHPWEGLWGFYALYGFIACVALVLVAKGLRTILMRPENYYASEETEENAEGKEDSNVDD